MDQILIVGAGPVGLTLAAELGRHGVRCRIIDKSTHHADDSRAVGIHARTLEMLEDMGVLTPFLQQGVKVTGINLYSHDNRLVHGKYQGFDTPHCFILDLPQTRTELILSEHLKSFGIEVERNIELNNLELKENSVEVLLKCEERSLESKEYAWVIGCDGARSTCRHLLEIPFPGDEYPVFWSVFDAKLDWPYDSQEMHLFLNPEGLVACFPLPHGKVRVVCELEPQEESHDPPPISFETMKEILEKRISKEVKIHEPSDLNPFVIHHRQAVKYRKGRAFIAGDAAHLHSPAGGQGMNTGMQDAYNLAWKLALVQKGLADPAILDTYEQERHPIAKGVLSITDKLTKMVTTKNTFLTVVRDMVMSFAGSFEKLRSQLPKRFSGLYLHYDQSAIVTERVVDHPPEHVRAGHRAPDHSVSTCKEQKEKRLFELFQGPHHTLLLFSGKKPSKSCLKQLQEMYNLALSNYPNLIQPYILYRNEEDINECPHESHCMVDREPSAHSHYGIEKATALLVRPDGYVGFVNEPPSKDELQKYLNHLFIPKEK